MDIKIAIAVRNFQIIAFCKRERQPGGIFELEFQVNNSCHVRAVIRQAQVRSFFRQVLFDKAHFHKRGMQAKILNFGFEFFDNRGFDVYVANVFKIIVVVIAVQIDGHLELGGCRKRRSSIHLDFAQRPKVKAQTT